MANVEYGKICFFTVYNRTTRSPIYTKYNFDFVAYKLYSKLPNTVSNTETFNKFLVENQTDYSKPLTVKPDLVKFFKPMTTQIINYMRNYGYTIHPSYLTYYNPASYILPNILVEKQFTIDSTTYYDDTQIRFVQDIFQMEDTSGKMYTKYNFDFNAYSVDFNVWGSKLQIFTDFISRCVKLGLGTVITFFGYLIPEQFRKYFLNIPGLEEYIINHGVTSNLSDTFKNPDNIDWVSYALENKFNPTTNIKTLKSHFYCAGQFELIKIKFLAKPLTNYQKIGNSVCTIYSKTEDENLKVFNGFLYKRYNVQDPSYYLVTSYDVIYNNPNTNTLRASFSINNNDELSKPITTHAEFNIIGYDQVSNILVAIYDPNADFNKVNMVDLTPYELITVSPNYVIENNEKVFSIGNLDNTGFKNLFSGTVVNKSYGGAFSSNLFLAESDKMIIDIPDITNCNGSPVFVCNNITSSDNNYTCVGMITSSTSKNKTNFHKRVIKNNFLFNTVQKIISAREAVIAIPGVAKNPILLNYYLRLSIPKAWLGTVMSYYNTVFSINTHPALMNFPYTGGVVIEKFIYGIDIVKQKFITNANDLGSFDIVKLDTPLLNSKMYNRYIDSSKTPIVIKSITYYESLHSEYKTFYFGKYGNQDSFYKFTYGLLPIYNRFDYTNFLLAQAQYNTIKIDYYYYNGQVWLEESEKIGGNDSSWYNTLTDSLGNKITQHKFQFPFPLLSYQFTNDFQNMI